MNIKFISVLITGLLIWISFPSTLRAEDGCKPAVSGRIAVDMEYEVMEEGKETSTREGKSKGGSLTANLMGVRNKMAGVGEKTTTTTKKKKIKRTARIYITPRVKEIKEWEEYQVSFDVEAADKDVPPEAQKVIQNLGQWHQSIYSSDVAALQRKGEMKLTVTNPCLKSPVEIRLDCRVDCKKLQNEFLRAQKEYEKLCSAMSFKDQFELFSETMEQVEKVLSDTAGDIKGHKDEVNEKFDDLMQKTEGLSDKLTETLEKIKESETAKQLEEGLDKATEKFEEAAELYKEINKYTSLLKKGVEARDKSASEQLDAFKEYFGEITGFLEPLVKTIPVLGVFLDLYQKAVEQIAISVGKIEDVVAQRRRDVREQQKQDEFFRDVYMEFDNEEARMKREQNEKYNEMNRLKDRIIDKCGDAGGVPESMTVFKIIDARERASKECGDKSQKEAELMPRIARLQKRQKQLMEEYRKKDEACKRVQNPYRSPRYPLDRKYSDAITKYLRSHDGISRKIITKIEEQIQWLERRREFLNKKYSGKKWPDQAREEYNQISSQDIPALQYNLGEMEPRLKAFEEAEKLYDQNRDQLNNLLKQSRRLSGAYDQCRKDYIMKKAKENHWDMDLVRSIHSDLFK